MNRLFRLTHDPAPTTLNPHTQDSPYIRCMGFLYLRYGCDPKELWEWFSPYIDDPEEFAPSSDPNLTMCVGSK